MYNKKKYAIAALAAGVVFYGQSALAEINLGAIGIVSTHLHHTEVEKDFYANLADTTGLDISVNFNPLNVVGVKMQDTLRFVRSGAFDVVQTTISAAARDDPFIEGIDLIGVSPDLDTLKEVVEVYRTPLEKRFAERFNARVMSLWPSGPQVFFCKGEVDGVQDLKGLRVRSYSISMSALLEELGATPVTMQFAEVYPALQRGVAECAVSSPPSANTGNWPEVTDSLVMHGISWAMNGHFMNLDTWNSLPSEAQEALDAAYQDLEDQYWDMARNLNDEAVNCTTGGDDCEGYNPFNMTLKEPSEGDIQLVNEAVESVILPLWADTCDQNYPECSRIWNETIGELRGLTIN